MRFSEYMQAWLYGDSGYYSSYAPIGKDGDFYTAVSSSKFFGGTIAQHIISTIDEGFLSPDAHICEIGAHRGYLLADIIEFIYTLRPELLKSLKFCVVERYEKLRAEQKSYFEASFGKAIDLLQYSSLEQMRVDECFFIANEIFDAFTCELLHNEKFARLQDHKVLFDIEDQQLLKRAKALGIERGEIAVGYEQFAIDISKSAKVYEFMSFDYGQMRSRGDFSIRVYKEHEVFAFFDEQIDHLQLFQKSDITYDVNFSHLQSAFSEAGVEMVEFKTQLKALVDMGIISLLEILKERRGDKIYTQELEKVKRLILPEFQGERFKMIRFRKG